MKSPVEEAPKGRAKIGKGERQAAQKETHTGERQRQKADLGVSQMGSVAAMATTTRASLAHPKSAPASSTLPIQGSTGNPARAVPTTGVSFPI